MIFHEHRLAFVHIPKTGGCSILRALGSHPQGHFPVSSTKYDGVCHYTTACFVRNPWDRTVSSFYYLLAGGSHEGDRRLQQKHLRYATFRDNILHWRDLSLLEVNHFKPQLHWIDGGVDFIGRFDNLQEDFDVLCERCDIPKRRLPRLNTSQHPPYVDCYDDETKAVVCAIYQSEIEMFDFVFEQ